MLGSSPRQMNFESAHFKLTEEYVQLLGGKKDPLFVMFEDMLLRGFQVLCFFCIVYCTVVLF